MNTLEIIEAKKRGRELAADALRELVRDFTDGQVPAYQMAAFLMAVWFRKMTPAETVALTAAMLESGAQLDVSALGGPTADKHSTGGVGDKVSLLLAPLAAACGLRVPMLSGRGLGHTGGTLDKLEAIPGYRIHMTNDEFMATVAEVGCAIVGQSANIAPADGKIYALRDVTATIDCVPLITASILSKKLAAGPQTIVIDLKTGSGAFMADMKRARELADALVHTAEHWGRRVAVVFSDMSQPLGVAVGHAVETIEAFAALRPGGRAAAPADLVDLTEDLVTEMVRVAAIAPDRESALALVRQVWDSGQAWQRLLDWVRAQGGRIDPQREDFGLDVADRALEVGAPTAGHVVDIQCRDIGLSLADIGGARLTVDDPLDLSAGLFFHVKVGQRVDVGQPLATIHTNDVQLAAKAARRIEQAVTIGSESVPHRNLILDRLGA